MAKKMTPTQATAARDELGIDPSPLAIELVAPRSPSAIPTGPSLEARRVAAAADPGPTIWEETKAAFRVDNSMGRLLGDTPVFLIDVNYSSKSFITENIERIDALMGADREEIATELGSASSSEEAEYRLQGMEKDFRDEQTLYEGGISAMALRMVAAIADPIDMAAALATGGVVGGLVKAGKVGKIITGALSAGIAAGTSEAILAQDNVFRDETDVVFATLAGITLGGALKSLSRSDMSDLNKAVEELANDNIDGAAKSLGLGESAGAARRRHQSDEPNQPLKNTDDVLADMEAPTFKYRAWNWLLNNLQSKMFYSKSVTLRKVASTMFEGGFLKDRSKTRGLTVEGRAQQLQDVYERGIYAETLKNFKAWAKRTNKGSAARIFGTSVGEDFYSQVGKAMRGITKDISPEAAQAAKSIEKQMAGVYELAQRAGVKGFNGDALKNYFPRMMNSAKFTEIRGRVGDDALRKFYAEAIIRGGNEGMTEGLANKISRAFVHTMRLKSAGIETDLLHGVRLDDVDKLREIFKGYDEIDELIAEIESMKIREQGKRGTVSFGKQRITFDETYEDLMTDLNGKTFTFGFSDVLENDARMVLARYGRAMHGHIAMAEKLGVKSRGEFEELKQAITSEIEAQPGGGNVKREIEALEDGYNLILGQPIARWNPGGDAAKMSRTMSGWQYTTRGGQFGVNALAEAGNIIGQAGLRNIFRMFPDFSRVMTRGVDGQLDHRLARFAEMGFAPGISVLTKPAVRNLDELAEGFEGATTWISRLTAALDPYVKTGGRFTSIASALGPVTDATQRMSAVAWIDKLSRFANGAKMSPGQVSRLRANGINAEMQERIFAMFRSQADGGAGVYRKGRLIDVDIDKWVDNEAYDVFTQAASREVRNAIQLGDVATSTTLFTHPAGRLIFQFMRFPMDAVNKQLLRGWYHMDAETLTAWTTSYGIGAMAYIAQTNIDYANDEEERMKRLEFKNVASVAFMRTGMSSMLPAPIDAGFAVLGMDRPFVKGRSSGLGTIFPLESNPSGSALKNASIFGGGLLRSSLFDDTQFSQADFRAGAQLIPGYRLLGLKNIVHALEKQFPESRDQE